MIAGFVVLTASLLTAPYLSFMSANTTQTAYKNRPGQNAAAVPSALAIFCFVGGTIAGALLRIPRSVVTALVFVVVAASLALIFVFYATWLLYGGVHIAVLSFAMGMGNTHCSRVGAESVSLTFMTGTLSKLGCTCDGREAFTRPRQPGNVTHIYRALILAGIWAGFLPAHFCRGSDTHFGVWALFFPMLIPVVAGGVRSYRKRVRLMTVCGSLKRHLQEGALLFAAMSGRH